ncbi:MAG: fructosamine kinase family protein [Alphaproteobacteria bacterium]|jgi:fructosamine-3-kinase|nr:fructosamine kinase family protein [Alphaproteobacteria bacterium]
MTAALDATVEAALGIGVSGTTRLGGGHGTTVTRVRLADGEEVVAKTCDRDNPGLGIEAAMLESLATLSRLPVPEVLHGDARLLIMSLVPGETGNLKAAAQVQAADLIADLHGVRAKTYGFDWDTVIGGLMQINTPSRSWIDFFRDRRLLAMAEQAFDSGALPGPLRTRIDKLAGRLDDWIEEPSGPALIHGDLWDGNVLSAGGRITGFIDPAIYYADPEIELAFGTLFKTFDQRFFDRYQEIRALRPGFFEARRDLYNLYPLLVHVRLFGGTYVASVERIVTRFGG